MALIKCKDCSKEYSTDAKRCPHCGANRPDSANGGCLLWFFALLFGFIPMSVIGDKLGSTTTKDKDPRDYVLDVCMRFTKETLHDPASADFDYPYPAAIMIGANEYKMVLGLRAKNGFGALRHFAVECVVQYQSDEKWTLKSLKEIH